MTAMFTGEDLAKRLAAGGFKMPILRVGMVKQNEAAPDSILFALGGCSDWIDIPVGLIEHATFLRNVPCRDHEHPLVALQFKEPEGQGEAERVFAELARHSPHGWGRAAPSAAMPGPQTMGGTRPAGMAGHAPSATTGAGGGFGSAGPTGTIDLSSIGGGGLGLSQGAQGLRCIVWHEVCEWVTLWISQLNTSIPFYYCHSVCDIYAP